MPLSRQLMSRTRIEMRPSGSEMADVLFFGRYNHTRARPALTDHVHRGAIEICFLVTGRQTYRLADHSYRLVGGDVFITLPDERHSTGGLPQEKGVLYWMILQVPRGCRGFLGLPERQSRALLKELLEIQSRHFRGSWKMKEHLDAITSLYHEKRNPLNMLAMRNRTEAFLLELIAAVRTSPVCEASPLSPVFRYVEKNLGEPLPAASLAAQAGLSVARFKTRFKDEVGVPPGEYVLRARIEEAQKRLALGASITDIAYALGFSSSQYFATVFKRFTGQTPSEARKNRDV